MDDIAAGFEDFINPNNEIFESSSTVTELQRKKYNSDTTV